MRHDRGDYACGAILALFLGTSMQISDGRLASFRVLPLLLLLSVAAYGMFWSAVSCSSVVLCYLLFAAVAWLAQLMCNPEVVLQFVLMSGDCHVAGCVCCFVWSWSCLVLVVLGCLFV